MGALSSRRVPLYTTPKPPLRIFSCILYLGCSLSDVMVEYVRVAALLIVLAGVFCLSLLVSNKLSDDKEGDDEDEVEFEKYKLDDDDDDDELLSDSSRFDDEEYEHDLDEESSESTSLSSAKDEDKHGEQLFSFNFSSLLFKASI